MHDKEVLGPVLNTALATFLVVSRVGSISAASHELHLSQPAITRRLQALERELGAPLFDRLPTGLRLNSVGEAMLPHARRAVAAEVDGLRAVTDQLDGAAGRVAMGVVGSLAGRWLSDVLAAVAVERPSVDVAVSTATSRQIRDQVLAGEVDIGVSYARPADADLELTVAFHEAMVVVVASGHPRTSRPWTLADLRDERWLMFPETAGQPESSGTIARNLLVQHQVPPERIRPIDSLSAQRALARAGYGLAFVPESAVADEVAAGELAVIDVVDAEIVTPVTVMTRRGAYRSVATSLVLDQIAAASTDSPSASPASSSRTRGATSVP